MISMAYEIKKMLIEGPAKKGYRNGVGKPEGVCLHSTANFGDSAVGERNFESNSWSHAYVHFFVDHDSIVQVWDTDYIAWGAGPMANPRYIHIELCQSKDKSKFLEAYKRYVWLAAYVLKQYGMKPEWGKTLVTHHWVTENLGGTTHVDPDDYLQYHGYTVDQLIQDVQKAYDELNGKPADVVQPSNHQDYDTNGNFHRNLSLTSPMMRGEDVRNVQKRLQVLADGVFGEKTKQAVMDWQKAHDMVEDGVVDELMWKLLFGGENDFDNNDKYHRGLAFDIPQLRGADVQRLQKRLEIEQNGFFGEKTRSAVINWQKAHGFNATGGVNEELWNALFPEDAKPAQNQPANNSNDEEKPRLLRVIADELWVYDKPDWNAKCQTVKKGDVFTITHRYKVGDGYMYQLKSGLYITASPKYVELIN